MAALSTPATAVAQLIDLCQQLARRQTTRTLLARRTGPSHYTVPADGPATSPVFDWTLLFHPATIGQRVGVDEQIRAIDPIDTDRTHAFADTFRRTGDDDRTGAAAGLQRGEHLVDRRLAGIAASRPVASRLRGSSVDDRTDARALRASSACRSARAAARLGFFAHEMPPFVVARRAAAAGRPGVLEPRRRECAAEPGHAQRADDRRRAVAECSADSRGCGSPRFPRGDAVEVLVVAFDPVERRRRLGIRARAAGQVADTDPQRHVGMPSPSPRSSASKLPWMSATAPIRSCRACIGL